MIDVLNFIKEKLEAAGINYQFGEWTVKSSIRILSENVRLMIMFTRIKNIRHTHS